MSNDPGEDVLDDLYKLVFNGFASSSAGSDSPLLSPSEDGSANDSNVSTGVVTNPMLSPTYMPSPLSQRPLTTVQPTPVPAAGSANVATTTRRRPLPQPPSSTPQPSVQSSSRQPTTSASAPASQPGPSNLQSQASTSSDFSRSRPLSRKISRIYSPTRYSSQSQSLVDGSGAGSSGVEIIDWDAEEDVVPTSPTTEYPDQFLGPFLPSYIEKVHDDPNASASLGLGPPIEDEDEDYTAPPPEDTYEASIADSRYQSMDSQMLDRWRSRDREPEQVNLAPDAGTTMSSYSMLRPPSAHEYMHRSYTDSESMYINGADLSTPNVAEATIPLARRDTTDSYIDRMGDWTDPSDLSRRNTNVIRQIANFTHFILELHGNEEADSLFDDDVRRFINPALLSHLAVQLRDLVPRGTHVKGSIPYPRAFTGKDIVSTLHSIIQRGIVRDHGTQYPADRRAALLVARSLQSTLFFYEVEWGARVLQDGVEEVYMFMDDQEGASDTPIERAELPTGVMTVLTKCYSASCFPEAKDPCYAYSCPKRGMMQLPSLTESPSGSTREEWSKKVPREVLASLTNNEINRQTIIHKLISKEEQYIEDLNIVETVFIRPLRTANPPIMTPMVLGEFIEEVFGNILELLECNRRLLEVLYVRQREQHPIIQSVGDIFLGAAVEFRTVYPEYVGHHPLAEKRMKEELEHNAEFRLFIEKCSRQLAARPGGSPRLDLKHYLNRPGEHLQKYPVLLDAVYRETEQSNPDGDYLLESIAAIQNLQNVAQLRTFQSAMGKGNTGKWEWHDLVSPEMLGRFTREEQRRQSVIFELIKGEMAYVRDLENIETMYVRPLRNSEPPVIPPKRLDQFITDVFHNYNDLRAHHIRLVEALHEIQREEHPRIRSITEKVFDAALNFREAYMEYIPNYPIAAYRIDEEMANNHRFKTFVSNTIRHPDAHRLDMKSFINRPIPRLLRYELLLQKILTETPMSHDDREIIPQVIEVIKALGRETEPGVAASKQKVELWKYNSNLVFKTGENVDMDLLNEQRSLIHTGKLLCKQQQDSSVEEILFVMLFDNYLVMTQPQEHDGITKYHVYRRPIPLDLLNLVSFNDSPIQRSASKIRSLRNHSSGGGSVNSDRPADTMSVSSREHRTSRVLYPFTIHHYGRLNINGTYTLCAESSAARQEWKQKLEESKGLRKVVQESNKVFELETLSVDTFLLPSMQTGPNSSVWHDGTLFTGKVTCSVPFNTPDGRGLVAIGCAEGVWIGYRHDSRSLRRVLHLKMVTQCSILDEFGLFLVLADKVLFAYHLEALVPTTPGSIHASQTPQKVGKDVHFFSVGVSQTRTLVIYMRRKGNDCIFTAVEPIIDKINERPRATGGILRRKNEWFRTFKEFSFPEAHDLIFLRARIAVLCAKGFMILDLNDYKSVNIPQRDDPNFPYLTKRCDACRPLGIFRSGEDEFLLCYDEIGLFVDRQGHPSRKSGVIEWEGIAERVALHAPYVLLFDTRFIEIRHLETGRLVQIITGNEIRCVWDGRSIDGSTSPTEGTDERMDQEPRIHAVLNMPEPTLQPGRSPRGIMQHVIELFPTIPLYLPGALSSPSTVPYFPTSYSPPRSPPTRTYHI